MVTWDSGLYQKVELSGVGNQVLYTAYSQVNCSVSAVWYDCQVSRDNLGLHVTEAGVEKC